MGYHRVWVMGAMGYEGVDCTTHQITAHHATVTVLPCVVPWGTAAHQITTALLHGVLPPVVPPPMVLPVVSSLYCCSCAAPCCAAATALPHIVPWGAAAYCVTVMPPPVVLLVVLLPCCCSHSAPHHATATVPPHVVLWGVAACCAATHGNACHVIAVSSRSAKFDIQVRL